ncbi:MAG: hypothetical protein JNM03_10785 [Sphingopyxis sp.]|uniref:hypothetical protein n=1 Tax=Sphingopyxis sp. TaxID=1908224 RepID=UPI001A4797A9|nr:hypothetical protein [Sphingopyxis sp.]MBL9070464.1 hypothetical protein [Sphingopyxis sp.]
MPAAKCSAPDCDKIAKLTKGLCPTHYQRLLRHGRIDAGRGWDSKAHLHSKHELYPTWQQMILRCHDNKNSSFARYGAVGISVCERWRANFQNFLADMGERPKGLTLDRIDPTGNYEPGNCRWADAKTQRNNLSEEGDKRARAKISASKTEYWKRWRTSRGLPAEAPTRAEYRARSKG